MWKVPLSLVTAGFSAPFFYTRVGAKFWEMCNLFSTFPRPVKIGEWNVKNPLNFVPAYKHLVGIRSGGCGHPPLRGYLPFVRRSQPNPNLIRYLIIKGWLSDGSPIG